jgi:hypothetical protein
MPRILSFQTPRTPSSVGARADLPAALSPQTEPATPALPRPASVSPVPSAVRSTMSRFQREGKGRTSSPAPWEVAMRAAGCPHDLVTQFKQCLGSPSTDNPYLQTMLADLGQRGHTPANVQSYVDGMRAFHTLCGLPQSQPLAGAPAVSLGSKGITEMPPEFHLLGAVVALFASRNKLSGALPVPTGSAQTLTVYHASGNDLTTVDGKIAALVNLEALDLADNRIAAVDEQISKLTQLRSISLRGNQLTAVPRGLISLPGTLVNLLDNPIPPPDAQAVREELVQRRAQGQSAAQIFFSRQDLDDAADAAAPKPTPKPTP